jgi:molecular chaperone GrpE
VEGFRQIQKKLLALLEEEGVSAIPAEGEFDPMLHEAVMSEPSETVESGHITGLLRGGYLHKGRVLRPALVRVAL